ncbi:MAG: tetratricopeptide repeat protein [Bacteroidales bacterium]|nr:tetratricopeptide repeat protein [Bacteroidales bacterium]
MRLNRHKNNRLKIQIFKVFVLVLFAFALNSCGIIKKSDKSDEDPRIKDFNFNYHFLEANKQKILGDFEQALQHYTAALKVDDTQSVVYYEIAGILNMAGDYQAAVEYAKKAVSLDNTDNEYYQLLLTFVYRNAGANDLAAEVYKDLIKTHPDKINYYFELASIYVALDDTKSALKILQSAEDYFGINEMISLEKEAIYDRLNDDDKAIAEIQKLVDNFPENSKYKTLLAESYVNAGRNTEAKAVYQSIEDQEINDGIIYFSMADFYRTQGDYENAFKYLALGMGRDDVDMDIKVRLMIQLLDIMGDDNYIVGNMRYLIEVLTDKYPEELKVRALSSDYFMMTKNYEAAQKEFDIILAKDKSKYQIWEQALHLDFILRDMESMYRRSKEASFLFPNVIELYRFLVPSAYSTNNYTDVVEAVDYVAPLLFNDQPTLIEFLTMQGDAFHKLNKHHESDSVYELVLYKDAENVFVLNNYAYFLAERGEKLDRALELSTKLIELENENSIYLDTHAWVLFKSREFEKALEFIVKAISLDENNPVYYDHKGDILFKLNRIDQAVDAWKSSLEYGNDSLKIQQKINNKSID